ncbi:hypothetical protein [Streptococcus ovis]|uniref:hypothetical protein n=1 Tax=Streptococcus ovis TaxID=82806 RepID=UPI0003A7BE39|nr:hypothetical protein [Streptococcus ovis]
MCLLSTVIVLASLLGGRAFADTSLFRLYNPGLKVHLYTKDTNEYYGIFDKGVPVTYCEK